jgi:hypothetical protein
MRKLFLLLILLSNHAFAETYVCSHIADGNIVTNTFEREGEEFSTIYGTRIAKHTENDETLYLYVTGTTDSGSAYNTTWIVNKSSLEYVMQWLSLTSAASSGKYSGRCTRTQL